MLRVLAIALGLAIAACGTTTTTEPPTQPPVDAPTAPTPGPDTTVPAQAPVDVAEPPPPVPLAGDTPEIRAVLAKKYVGWTKTPGRIAMQRRGPVRLAPEGPDLGLADEGPFPGLQRYGVLVDGERPLLLTDTDGVRLLLYVRAEDAQPVVVADTPLRRRPTERIADPPRRGHIVLHPGAWVAVEETTDTAVRIRYHDGDVARRGWVEPDRLGKVAMIIEPPFDQEKADREAASWWTAKRRTTLQATPDGKVLERLEADDVVRALGPVRGGQRLVEHTPSCNRDLSFVGFVPSRDFHQPNYGTGYGCGYGSTAAPRQWGDTRDLPRVELSAGTFLTDATSTRLVGCVAKPSKVADLGDGTYAVATIWGPLTVRPAPADFAGACATEGK